MNRKLLGIIGVLASTLALGCGSAFGDALDRGDALARVGQWDRAAESYERAAQLRPYDPAVLARLAAARRHQAEQRVAFGRELAARGELVGALQITQEAVRLDPSCPDAETALAALNMRALAQGDDLLAGGRAKEALDLVLVLRRGAPDDPRGVDLETRAREELARVAYARAEALGGGGMPGGALLSFAEATQVQPGYRDAAARARALRAEIENALTFNVVLATSAPTPALDAEGERPSQPSYGEAADEQKMALLAVQELRDAPRDSTRPLLRVTGETPSSNALGIQMAMRLEDYRTDHDVRSVDRGCNYVCGVDRVPNPALDAAKQGAAQAARDADRAEADLQRAARDAARRARDLSDRDAEYESARRDVRKATEAIEACERRPDRSFGRRDGSTCRRERDALSARRESLQTADAGRTDAQSAARLADDTAGAAGAIRSETRRALQRALDQLASTSPVLELERVCAHEYKVLVYTVNARVNLALRAGVLGQGEPSALPLVPYSSSRTDETFDAQPGRCTEVAEGDPLNLPDEQTLQMVLVGKVVKAVRESMQGSYDVYRRGFQEDERRERAAGRSAEADEARVRYLLTSPGSPQELTIAGT